MLGAISCIIGLALAAGRALSNSNINKFKEYGSLGEFLKNLKLDVVADFTSDVSQAIILKIIEAIKNHRDNRRLENFINNKLNESFDEEDHVIEQSNVFNIIAEIKQYQEDERSQLQGKNAKPIKKVTKFDAKTLITMVNELPFIKGDIVVYLQNISNTFKNLYNSDDEEKRDWAKNFAQLIDITLDVHVKKVYYNSPDSFKVLAYILTKGVNTREGLSAEQLKQISDNIANKLLPFLANQYNGVVNFQAIANAKYAPKYIKNACPGCGYDGDRILIDEKTGTVKCAACGKTYNLAQYAVPDEYAELMKQVDKKIDEELNVAGQINGNVEEVSKNVEEIKAQLKEYYSQSLTRKYLDACIKDQTDQFHNYLQSLKSDVLQIGEDFNGKLNEVKRDIQAIQTNLLEKSKEILENLKNQNSENKKVMMHFSQRLDSLDKQVNSLYEYAQEMFPELSDKSNLILEYVQKLCSKEYYEEMSNALGTDISKAVSMEMQHGYANIQALNASSISQIISAIEDLKNDCTNEKGVIDYEGIKDSIKRENTKLSGKIIGLQELINSCNESNKASFRTIIEKLDDIRALQLGTSTVKGFEKIYLGDKLPYRLLPNKGFKSKRFPCFYCGAEAVEVNDDYLCYCSVCGNTYAEIEPFHVKEEDVKGYLTRFKEEDLPLPEKISAWQEKRTATVTENEVTCGSRNGEGLYIIPKSVDNNCYLDEQFARAIKTLIFANGITQLSSEFLRGCVSLNTIVFQQSNGISGFRNNVIAVPNNNVTIIGKNYLGVPIHGQTIN